MTERKDRGNELPPAEQPTERPETTGAEAPGVFMHPEAATASAAQESTATYAEHIKQIHEQIAAFTDEDFTKMLETMEAGEPMEFRELGVIEDKVLLYRVRMAAKERLLHAKNLSRHIHQRYGVDVNGSGIGNSAMEAWRRLQSKDFVADMERYRSSYRKSMNLVERANLLQFKLTDPEGYGKLHAIDTKMHQLEHDIRTATGVEARDILEDAMEPKERKALAAARENDPTFERLIHDYRDARAVITAMMETDGIDLDQLTDEYDDRLLDDGTDR